MWNHDHFSDGKKTNKIYYYKIIIKKRCTDGDVDSAMSRNTQYSFRLKNIVAMVSSVVKDIEGYQDKIELIEFNDSLSEEKKTERIDYLTKEKSKLRIQEKELLYGWSTGVSGVNDDINDVL
jgi:hypothetical protein